MRRVFFAIIILSSLAPVSQSFGATGRVIKVLPHFLDLQGRAALSPSLYDRDAYQAVLRDHPEKRSGLRFDMQWKTKGTVWSEPMNGNVECLIIELFDRGVEILRQDIPR